MTTDKLLNFIRDIRGFLIVSSLLFYASTPIIAAEKQMLKAKAAEFVGGSAKVVDSAAYGDHLVRSLMLSLLLRFQLM